MPTNSIEGIALYYRSENGTLKKLSRIDGTVTVIDDDNSPECSTFATMLQPITITAELKLPWYKNNHLAKYGKNRRIRNKNKKLAQKRFESIFF